MSPYELDPELAALSEKQLLARIVKVLETNYATRESTPFADYDLETIGASTQLTVITKFSGEFRVKLKKASIDLRNNTTYTIIVNGIAYETEEYEPAKPITIGDGEVIQIIQNTDAASQKYYRGIVGWGEPVR